MTWGCIVNFDPNFPRSYYCLGLVVILGRLIGLVVGSDGIIITGIDDAKYVTACTLLNIPQLLLLLLDVG